MIILSLKINDLDFTSVHAAGRLPIPNQRFTALREKFSKNVLEQSLGRIRKESLHKLPYFYRNFKS